MALNNTQLVTERFRDGTVQTLIEAISSNEDIYYVFAGRSLPYPNNDTDIFQPMNSTNQLVVDAYQNMIFGKRLAANDVIVMAPRYDWVANTVFAMYNDQDANLYNENFYTTVNATSQYHTFKCLYNNGGAPSLFQPTFGDTNSSDAYYETSDGYLWKYLFSVDATPFQQFATSDFIPVIPNANTKANTIDGAIDVIITSPDQFGVNQSGSGYNNYLAGQFQSSDIQVGGNNIIYGVANNASNVNGYYSGCILYINGGTGAGQFVSIVDYRVIGLAKEVIVNTAFTTSLDATSTYQINPAVQIVGDDNVTINAFAMALINAASSNSVYNVNVLQRGKGYRIASANVISDISVGVTNTAVLDVIIPPPGGHGFDVYNELGGTMLGISLTFANNESNTIPTQNGYRTIGIVKNPVFANVQLNLLDSNGDPGANGNFIFNEQVYQIRPILLAGSVSTNTGSTTVVGSGTDFMNQFDDGDFIYILGGRTGYIGQVAGVVNSSSLTLSSNCLFTNAAASFALAEVVANGYIVSISPSTLNIVNVSPTFVADSIIIGANSFAIGNVASYTINNEDKTFLTYIQARRYVGSLESGTFITDETVFEGAITISNASFHSINTVSNTVSNLFVTNQDGKFNVGNTIQGESTGSLFSITAAFPGDLVLDSGEIVYLENNPLITRADTQSETVKIVLLF